MDSPAPRRVRVATTCIRPPEASSAAQNLDLIAAVIDKVAEKRPDIICLPETVAVSNVAGPVRQKSQPVPGPFTQMLSDKARTHRTYIVGSLLEADAGAVYNTAVLVDRLGRLVGKARKVHLPLAEAEAGVAPGNEYPVFTTDLGRIGILTCWDNWFPEAARILRLKGAEMIFLPIEADLDPVHWDVVSRARAIDNGVYFISSSIYEPSTSRIIDPAGTVLAETGVAGGIAVADIDLNREWPVRHLSVGPAQGDPRSLYIIERRPDTYGPLAGEATATPSAAPAQ